ncbi:unnamed protein product [Parascedosporium putredinis]|uniref:PNPLA domain-containing protein n=1 Tax=Parascedosporium putredinis TaxID=1442378 RepID=A0A9P1H2X7_9PEZI|nr:unnamed protein product [Parascedosporium putredinis]CAI7995370.1 unnamed protein product [Parascedosporium putredinis]
MGSAPAGTGADMVRAALRIPHGALLRILSLDGGGVRGYSMLIILQEIMHRTYVEIEGKAPRRDQIPKPADHFDLIIGTGTGG